MQTQARKCSDAASESARALLRAVNSLSYHRPCAKRNAQLKAIEEMLWDGANPASLVAGCDFNTNAIIAAASGGDEECLELLLSAPCANPDAIDSRGQTALMMAIYASLRCVSILAKTSDVNIKNADGDNALMQAVKCGSMACVKILAPLTNLNATNADAQNVHHLAKLRSTLRPQGQAILLLLASLAESETLEQACGNAHAANKSRRL